MATMSLQILLWRIIKELPNGPLSSAELSEPIAMLKKLRAKLHTAGDQPIAIDDNLLQDANNLLQNANLLQTTELGMSDLTDLVLDIVRSSPPPVSSRHIAEAVTAAGARAGGAEVRNKLTSMTRRGLLQRVTRGYYRLPAVAGPSD